MTLSVCDAVLSGVSAASVARRLLYRRAGRAAAPARGPRGDFGKDILAEHYKADHKTSAPGR